jgi:nucleotide-binding universal stress UspA family protein
MKVILVPVSNRPESKSALQVSFDLADHLDANIVACHLRPNRSLEKDYKPTGVPLFGSANREWLDELNVKSSKSAAREANKTFTEIVEQSGFRLTQRDGSAAGRTARWQEKVGSPDKLMAILGPVADMTVLSRPSAGGNIGRMFLLAALMHTGRPILVVPPKLAKAPGKRVTIAWNQSPEVCRIVSSCMPMLQAADAVNIVACGRQGRLGPKASQLKSYLKNWGVSANVLTTPGKKEETELLTAYRDTKSDLLMMGAYSRSRFREVVFGGMTEFMLWNAKVPVIIQHT